LVAIFVYTYFYLGLSNKHLLAIPKFLAGQKWPVGPELATPIFDKTEHKNVSTNIKTKKRIITSKLKYLSHKAHNP
jgi:hypothetical protein